MKNKITRNEIKRCFLLISTPINQPYVTYIAPLYEAIKPDTHAKLNYDKSITRVGSGLWEHFD